MRSNFSIQMLKEFYLHLKFHLESCPLISIKYLKTAGKTDGKVRRTNGIYQINPTEALLGKQNEQCDSQAINHCLLIRPGVMWSRFLLVYEWNQVFSLSDHNVLNHYVNDCTLHVQSRHILPLWPSFLPFSQVLVDKRYRNIYMWGCLGISFNKTI